MYRVIVESIRTVKNDRDAMWTSPEWVRIWETRSEPKAKRRFKELRRHKQYRVTMLHVVRGRIVAVFRSA